jgi:hypothetical protein
MKYPVDVTDLADGEAEKAYLWMLERSPEGAARWWNGLEAAILSLEEMPVRCPTARPPSGAVSPDTDWIPGLISLLVDLVSWPESRGEPSHLTGRRSVDQYRARWWRTWAMIFDFPRPTVSVLTPIDPPVLAGYTPSDRRTPDFPSLHANTAGRESSSHITAGRPDRTAGSNATQRREPAAPIHRAFRKRY